MINFEEGTWKGKKIKDMSRDEILNAWHDTDSLYRKSLIKEYRAKSNGDEQVYSLSGRHKRFQLYITPKIEGKGLFIMLYGHPNSKGKKFYATSLGEYNKMSEDDKINHMKVSIDKLKNHYKESGHSVEEVNWNPIQLELEVVGLEA